MIRASLCAVEGNGLGRPQLGLLPAEERPQSAIGAVQRVAASPAADNLASGRLFGLNPSQEWPLAIWCPACLADHLQRRVGVHAVDPEQGSGHPERWLRTSKRGANAVGLLCWGSAAAAVGKPLGFNLPVALGNGLIHPVQLQVGQALPANVPQATVLWSPVRLGPGVAESRQPPFPGHNGPNDFHVLPVMSLMTWCSFTGSTHMLDMTGRVGPLAGSCASAVSQPQAGTLPTAVRRCAVVAATGSPARALDTFLMRRGSTSITWNPRSSKGYRWTPSPLSPHRTPPAKRPCDVRSERGKLAHRLLAAVFALPRSEAHVQRHQNGRCRRSRLLAAFTATHQPLPCRRVARGCHQQVTIYRTGAPPRAVTNDAAVGPPDHAE